MRFFNLIFAENFLGSVNESGGERTVVEVERKSSGDPLFEEKSLYIANGLKIRSNNCLD